MALTPAQMLIGRIAAVAGTLQGLAWAGMSLTCIILYNSNRQTFTTTDMTFTEYLNMLLYLAYLNKDETYELNRVIRSKDFTVIMWFYFFFSIALLTASVDLGFAIRQNKNRQSKLMIIWGILTGCTSIIDFVFTTLLARDFNNCPITVDALICRTIVGVTMTLAARGFMLWIVNVFLTYMTISNGIQIITHHKVRNAVQDITIPRAKVQQSSTPIFSNPPTYPNGSPVGQSPMFQNGPREFPSFIKNENKYGY